MKILHPVTLTKYIGALILLLGSIPLLCAEGRTWETETVARGLTTSIAVDSANNLHLVYMAPSSAVIYAFRPAHATEWISNVIVESAHASTNIYPRIAVGSDNSPHICVAYGELRYITLANKKWVSQQIGRDAGTLSYHCSVAIGPDDKPHVTVYHEFLPSGKQYTHLRHASLEDGVWLFQSVDGGISGKWNSMTLDTRGYPRIAYSQWTNGSELRFAAWNGQGWDISVVDSAHNTGEPRGWDNSIALMKNDMPAISYMEGSAVKYAYQEHGWKLEDVGPVNAGYDHYSGSTTLLMDASGEPHIVYGDVGAIRHAYREGGVWQIETIVTGSMRQYSNVDAAFGADGTLYVSYPDPDDDMVTIMKGVLKPLIKIEGQAASK